MLTRHGCARVLAGLLTLPLLCLCPSPATAGHLGGRPESFQPDLATGRFTTSIPLPVPPGRRGLQPSLAITYASGAAGGLCGYGWTLEAAATEKSTRFGVVTNAENQGAYTFNIGGVASELVPINAEKTEWRAEAEGAFMKFTTPGWWRWEAWDQAGTHYVFETTVNDPNGRIYAYYLTRVQDVHGNTMTFTYDRDAYGFGQYLTQINYTGHIAGLTPTHQVKLTWETRPDPIASMREGLSNTDASYMITRRLKTVETFTQGTLVRRVTLSYTTSASTGRSLLTSVTVTGTDGATSLPATTYTYSVPSATYQTATATTWLTGFGNSTTQSFLVDVDRDGKADLVTFDGTTGQWRYAKSTGAGFTAPTVVATAGANRQGAIGDFNGDGWTDLGTFDTSTGSGQTDIALATGPGTWGAFTRWLSNCGGAGYQWVPADFTGDGKTDWATWEPTNGYVHLGASTGAGFTGPGHCVTVGPNRAGFFGDFNGDGLTDFGTTDAGGNVDVWYGVGHGFLPANRWLIGFTSWQTNAPVPFDVNGDGRTDYVTFDTSAGTWYWGTSTTTQFTVPTQQLTAFGAGQAPLIGDVNGDGLADIGTFNASAGTWTMVLRHGDRPDLLTHLETGVGGSVDLTYVSSATLSNVDAAGQQTLGLTVPVLTAMTIHDGRGNDYAQTFTYTGGVFDHATQEFRGFAYAKVTDPDGHYTETYFHQDAHRKGKPYKEQVYAKSPGSTGPSEVVDQHQLTAEGARWLGHDGGDVAWLAQSFVPSGSGPQRVQTVALYVWPDVWGAPSGGFTVELQTDSGGWPSGTKADPNASVLLNPPQRGAWNAVTFPAPMDLTAGTRYWLVLKYAGTLQNSVCYGFGTSEANGYPAGTAARKYPTSPWAAFAGVDFAFKVWVTTPTTVNPPTLLQQVDRSWACTEPYPNNHFCYLQSVTTSLYDGQATPKQTQIAYTYDATGNVTQTVESGDLAIAGDERTTTTDYLANPAVWLFGLPRHTQVTDAAGTVWREGWSYYDGDATGTATPTLGRLTRDEVWLNTSATRPTTTHAYDQYGNKVSSTDPLGRTTTTTYDTQGLFPIRVTNVLGHTLQTTYDPGTGNVLTTTDPNGQVTTTTYDALGRPLAVIGPLDTPQAPGVLYSYDLATFPTKRVKAVRTTPGGSDLYTSYEFFDGLDRLIQVKAPAQDPTQQVVTGTQVFDTRGLVKEAYKPSLVTASTTFSTPDLTQPKVVATYDPLGRVTKQTQPDGTFSTTAYNQWTVTLTDEAGRQTVRTMDASGKLVTIEEKNSAETYTTMYTYDRLGNLTQTRDHAGHLTTITYDSVGRKTAMVDPDMGPWTYTYDAVGNLLTQTDAKNQVLTFTYDALNRVTQKTGPSIAVTYLYDDPAKPNGVGRLSKVTDGSGSTEFFYDLLGREIQTIKTVDGTGAVPTGGATSFTVARTYDALNRVTTLTYPDGEVLTYTYGPQGLATVTSPTTTYVAGLTYTATGQLAQQVLHGGLLTTTYTYDPTTLRLSTLKTTNGANIALQDLSYGFDAVGNVTTLSDHRRNQVQTFAYDGLHRLTQAQSPGTYGTRTYAYDPLGNLTTKDGVTQTYAHPTKPHAVTSRSDGLTMTYDANGNLLTKGTQSLAYDAENRLIQVTSGGTTQASFVYDGDGGRVQKVTATGTTTYLGKLWEVKPDGSTVKYLWAGSQRLASKSSTGATLFYHPNHLGSTDLVTDAAGTQVAHYEYAPYGELFSTEGITVPHQYTGKERDPETGFYFYEARYYDPQLGRFLTPDTIVPNWSNPQDFNRYTYAANNPLKYTDPTGHKPFWKKVASFFKKAASVIISVVVAVALGPAGFAVMGWAGALAAGGFAGGFGGTLINGGSIGQAVGMGMVGAFAGGVGGVAFSGLTGIARVAAMAAIGATAGASGAAIMGGNVGLGALAGGVAGAVAGGLGPKIGGMTSRWAQGAAALGTAAATGAAGAAITGGNAGQGALLGATGVIAAYAASASFQMAIDVGQKLAGSAGRQLAAERANDVGLATATAKSGNNSDGWTGHDRLLSKLGIYYNVERVEGTYTASGGGTSEFRVDFHERTITNMSPDMKFTVSQPFAHEKDFSFEIFGGRVQGHAKVHGRIGLAVHADE